MAMQAVDGPAGAPWERPLAGRLEKLVVRSEVLAGNPLGDPVRRPLYVYSSPRVASGNATGVPVVFMLQGFSGQLDGWLARTPFEPTTIERLDAMFADRENPAPDALVVFIDAWTSLGGSQFLNSTATGRYLDYICDEIVPFVDAHYPTGGTAASRGLAGKSSGGYGAMVLPMLRPGVFGGLASIAGDALFEACYLRDFPRAARALRDHYGGSYERFLEEFRTADTFDWGRNEAALNSYAMAAAYSPDPDRPGEVLLPFDTRTGRLNDGVWQLWLACDPVRMAASHAQALRGLRAIHLYAGRSDEYFLDLGAQAFSDELSALGCEHDLDLFAGRHGGISHRYPSAVRALAQQLS